MPTCSKTQNGQRRPSRRRSAFTLIELLVVLAIMGLLISILVPYLRASREEAKKVKCLANLRTILQASAMYTDDQSGAQLYPWYQVPFHKNYTPTLVTPWVFGGFRAPKPTDAYADSSQYPAQIRPLNKYIDRTAMASPFNFSDRGRDVIKSFICPGDRSNTTSIIGGPAQFNEEEMRSSWEANGSSFSLNTRWLQGYAGYDFATAIHDPVRYAALSSKIARHLVGGNASQFILWTEQGFYGATYNASPEAFEDDPLPPSLPQRNGWHRKFSSWSVAFADGHVSHGYFDTRSIYGLGGTIWQPNYVDEVTRR